MFILLHFFIYIGASRAFLGVPPGLKFSTDESNENVTVADSTEQSDTESPEWNCTLPPYPKNGGYSLKYPADHIEENNFKPGDKVEAFILVTTCNPGYVHRENSKLVPLKENIDMMQVALDRSLWIFNSYLDLDQNDVTACASFASGRSYNALECLPYCKPEKDDTYSCSGETRCVLPPPESSEANLRFIPSDASKISHQDCGLMRVAGQTQLWPSRSRRSVANGRPALRGELPWHAAIYTKSKRPYMQICGGSIISSKVVISAAHCFWNKAERKMKPAHKYAVAAGKLYRPWNDSHDEYAQKSDVADVRITPHFHGAETNFQDDLALVIVSTPFHFLRADSFVNPVCLDFDRDLDKEQLVNGTQGKVAGWGLISEDGPASPSLVVAEMPVVDIEQCFEETDPIFRPQITNDKFCAGYSNGTAVCHGDSGGGLIFFGSYREDDVSRYFLRGVVSSAPSNEHLCNTFTWATFTHLLRHEHFIRDMLKEIPAEEESNFQENNEEHSTLSLVKNN